METILTLDNGKNKISFKVSEVEDLKRLKRDLIEFVELDVNIYTNPPEDENEEGEELLFYCETMGGLCKSNKESVFF